MKRRQSYRRQIHQSDYFTVRALQSFLHASLAGYVHKGARVVDIGCGEAPLRGAIERLGARYFGFDIEPHSSGSVCALASVTALPIGDAGFDVVLCTEVLEHVYDVPRAISEIARILKNGGIAIITVPFMYPLHEEPHDFGRPTRFTLQESCRRAGLEILRLDALGDEMQVIASLLDNTWTRIELPHPAHHLWRAARVPLRLLGNAAFGALSLVLHRALPRKAYLGHALIARKSNGDSRSQDAAIK